MLRKIDILNAFLHVALEGRIVVTQPMGFEVPKNLDYVCFLKKLKHCMGSNSRPECGIIGEGNFW